ncbi:carbohydrate ABC transporter permease [Vallitalea guaymasensis]|uniref:carbohydrate ABC transporter permease n=1 Tax=Vallitalea guaymasensis TaxID=1185412 RepID=UPI002356A84B|nr:sugar ABC transporter permease [Vallitalea guaymasensis]
MLGNRQLSKKQTAILMSIPALTLLTVFLIVPFAMSFILSFTNQRLISNPNTHVEFIGLSNYLRLFKSEAFYSALLNNFKFTIIVVPIQVGLALLLAVLVNQKLKFINIFRTIYFSPIVITMIVVAIVWSLLFNPANGFINQLLSFISFGLIEPIEWLYDTKHALNAIIILSIWQGVGFQMIIVLAGLQGISQEVYEACAIDGTNVFQKFFFITIPMIKNTLVFCLLSTTILAFKLFTQVWVLTQGGPENSTMTMVALIYKEGFSQLRVGYASTISVVFFFIVLAISLIQRRIIDKEGN